MVPNVGIFLICIGAYVFLQVGHVNADVKGTSNTAAKSGNAGTPDTKNQQPVKNNPSPGPVSPPVGGSARGDACVFPFTYDGKTYYDCTLQDSLRKWCSLDEIYSGKWKYCTKDDFAPCFFPFNYKNKMYDSCTTEGSFIRRAWCSVTENYDKDGAWKYCY
ncbi:seminal plasma protein HSP-1-like [Myotis lucifugus]|uniref:seminal plasma protein HSP-1-like n=1 Tax=Myotis lucifugus TaxID=59463 RepID=UPI000CCC62D7|nr:seminal plasma protein HSP-1-like [Myotis lucifugus]